MKVREVIVLLESNQWRSSRRDVEIDLPEGGDWRKVKRYAVVFEKAESNWAAYVPDLPGCVATGKDRAETKRNIQEAIELHLEVKREVGEAIPEPTSDVDYVEFQSA